MLLVRLLVSPVILALYLFMVVVSAVFLTFGWIAYGIANLDVAWPNWK